MPERRVFTRRNLVLLLVALDLTALALLTGELVPSATLETLGKVITAVLGTALVAYTDAFRKALFRVADWPVSLWVSGFLLVFVVGVRFAPVTIPVTVDRDVVLQLDAARARLSPPDTAHYPGARSQYLSFSGVRTHALTLTTAARAHVPLVRYRITGLDLIKARIAFFFAPSPDSAAFPIPALLIPTLDKEAVQADMTIIGELPVLYRRWLSDSAAVSTVGSLSTIWVPLSNAPDAALLPLPAGTYTVRLSTCKQAHTFVITEGRNMLDMTEGCK